MKKTKQTKPQPKPTVKTVNPDKPKTPDTKG